MNQMTVNIKVGALTLAKAMREWARNERKNPSCWDMPELSEARKLDDAAEVLEGLADYADAPELMLKIKASQLEVSNGG